MSTRVWCDVKWLSVVAVQTCCGYGVDEALADAFGGQPSSGGDEQEVGRVSVARVRQRALRSA